MNPNNMYRRIVCVLSVQLVIAAYSLFAQSNQVTKDTLFVPTSTTPTLGISQQSDIVGFGLSYVMTDVSPYAYVLMPSTFYAHKFSEVVEFDVTAHFVSMAFTEQHTFYTFVSGNVPSLQVNAIRHTAYGIMSDATAVFSPLEGELRRLRIGVGASVRLAGRMTSEDATFAVNDHQDYQLFFTKQLALGINARIEYLLPLWKNAEIALRLHTNIFAPPVQIMGDKIPIGYIFDPKLNIYPSGGTIGLGAFLRIGF
jgi:hypothetical protein